MSELHEISSRLERLCDEVGRQGKKLDKLDHYLRGDPEDDKPSVLVRMDRLEQRDKIRGKLTWGALSAIVGLAIKAVWDAVASATK